LATARGADLSARRFDRLPHAARPLGDQHLVGARAGHGQHQRRGVAEILDEFDRPRALRQIANRVELEADVVELLADVLTRFGERAVDDGDAVTRDGLDLLDARVARDLLLDLGRPQTLDALSARPGPGADRHRATDLNLGVLAFRHRQVAVDAPQQRNN